MRELRHRAGTGTQSHSSRNGPGPLTPARSRIEAASSSACAIHVRPSGTSVLLKAETRDEAEKLLNSQYMSLYFRGLAEGESAGPEAPPHRLSTDVRVETPLAIIGFDPDTNMIRRYAEASGDRNPMHLDVAVARAVGFPNVLVHGLLTMALCGRAVVSTVCPGRPERLRRLAVRFSRPLFPGQRLDVSVWSLGERGSGNYGFEAAISRHQGWSCRDSLILAGWPLACCVHG
jgi:acyl dehydratase